MNQRSRYGVHSLRFKLVLASTLVEVLMLGLLVWNSVRIAEDTLATHFDENVRSLTPLLNASIAPALAERDYATLEEMLASVVRDESLKYVEVTDGLDRVVSVEGRPPSSKTVDAEPRPDDTIFDRAFDITLAGNKIGHVRYGMNIDVLAATTVRLREQGMAIAAVEIAITFVLLAGIGYLLTRHVRLLASAAGQIQQGDYSIALRESGRDEVADAARAFNRMARTIAEQIHALRESEARFRATFEQAAVGFAHLSLDGRFLRVNQKICDILGYRREELLTLTFQETTHPDDHERDIACARQLLAGAVDNYSLEKRSISKSGRTVELATTVSLVKTAHGEPDYFLAVVEDIGIRKRAEDAVRESERQYRELVDSMSQGLAVHEVICDSAGKVVDYRFLDANPSFERVTGLKREAIVGRTVLEVLPNTEAYWIEKFGRVALTGIPERFEDYSQELGRYYETLSYRPRPNQFAVLVSDVTERRRLANVIEAAAAGSAAHEDFYRDLLAKLADAANAKYALIGLIDQDDPGHVTTHTVVRRGRVESNFSYRIADAPCEQVISKSLCFVQAELPRLFPKADSPQFMDAESYLGIALLDSSNTPIGILALLDDKPMQESTEYMSLLRICAARVSGELLRELAFKRQQQINTELERRVKERTLQLEIANKEMEAFAYSVSHDLRAPLRAIDGFSQALIEDYTNKLDETGQSYLTRVRAATQRMGMLIDDLLMLSRVTRKEMINREIDLSAMVREIVDELRGASHDRNVIFTSIDNVRVSGDINLLRIALHNLLENAWKYTSRVPVAKIEFGVSNSGATRAYFVRDNGVGFDMQYAGKLFGAFQRLHHVEQFPGTGVGLAIASRVIHRHGGRIWATAEVGKGATFYFTLNSEPD